MNEHLKQIAELKERLAQSETRYNALMEQATDGIYLGNLNGGFIDINNGLCRMLGYSAEELLTMSLYEIIDPEQLKIDPLYQSGIEEKKTLVRERRFLRKDGTGVDVELNIKMVNENQALIIARDITDRKLMEKELRDAELKFRTIAEKSMVGVYIVQDGLYSYVNPRFAEIFGYQPDELLNKDAFETILDPEYVTIQQKRVQARLAGDIESMHHEIKGRKKDGSIVFIEFYGASAIIDGKKSIIGSIIDITERVITGQILNRSEAYLEAILNTTNTAFILFGLDFSVLALNKKTASFVTSRYNHVPVVGDKLTTFLPVEKYPAFYDRINHVLQGNNIQYELKLPPGPQNEALFFEVKMFPIRKENREILGFLIELYDITEHKDAENKLQEAYLQIQSQVNQIKEMTWKQSHLIRSPIANLKGLVNILTTDPIDSTSLNYIRQEIKRLDEIIIEMAGNQETA